MRFDGFEGEGGENVGLGGRGSEVVFSCFSLGGDLPSSFSNGLGQTKYLLGVEWEKKLHS